MRLAAKSIIVTGAGSGIGEGIALRLAAEARRKVRLNYRDLKDSESQRTVRPLGCFCWGAVWTRDGLTRQSRGHASDTRSSAACRWMVAASSTWSRRLQLTT